MATATATNVKIAAAVVDFINASPLRIGTNTLVTTAKADPAYAFARMRFRFARH
jgi:hypothetical protein